MSCKDRGAASRRTFVKTGFGVLAATAIRPVMAQQPPKIAQNLVMYQDHPKGDQQCSKCQHFQPPNSCQIVAGTISPNGWCGVFAAKPA
jgi:hypothetical protein